MINNHKATVFSLEAATKRLAQTIDCTSSRARRAQERELMKSGLVTEKRQSKTASKKRSRKNRKKSFVIQSKIKCWTRKQKLSQAYDWPGRIHQTLVFAPCKKQIKEPTVGRASLEPASEVPMSNLTRSVSVDQLDLRLSPTIDQEQVQPCENPFVFDLSETDKLHKRLSFDLTAEFISPSG